MRSDTPLNSTNDMAEDIDIEELLEAPYVKEMKKIDVSKHAAVDWLGKQIKSLSQQQPKKLNIG